MSTDPTSDKPKSVQKAVACLWASAGVAVVVTIAPFVGLFDSAGIVTATVTGIVSAALLALVAAKIDAGQAWARWLFVIVYALGSSLIVLIVIAAPQMFRAMPAILQVSSIGQLALQTAALVLMFTSRSRQWFEAKNAEIAP